MNSIDIMTRPSGGFVGPISISLFIRCIVYFVLVKFKICKKIWLTVPETFAGMLDACAHKLVTYPNVVH